MNSRKKEGQSHKRGINSTKHLIRPEKLPPRAGRAARVVQRHWPRPTAAQPIYSPRRMTSATRTDSGSGSRAAECPLWVISRHNGQCASCPVYPPIADIRRMSWHLRFVPKADLTLFVSPLATSRAGEGRGRSGLAGLVTPVAPREAEAQTQCPL